MKNRRLFTFISITGLLLGAVGCQEPVKSTILFSDTSTYVDVLAGQGGTLEFRAGTPTAPQFTVDIPGLPPDQDPCEEALPINSASVKMGGQTFQAATCHVKKDAAEKEYTFQIADKVPRAPAVPPVTIRGYVKPCPPACTNK